MNGVAYQTLAMILALKIYNRKKFDVPSQMSIYKRNQNQEMFEDGRQ